MLKIQKLIYGDRNLIISSLSLSKDNFVSPVDVAKFLLTLNNMNYSIRDFSDLFKLSKNDFLFFKEELFSIFDSMKIDGFIFRDKFANTIELTDYSDEDWIAMFAQYSITYNWENEFNRFFNKTSKEVIDNYFNKDLEYTSFNTNLKTFDISFNKEDLSKIILNILESKIVLREQEIKIIENVDINILKNVFEKAEIKIKEIEIYVYKRILNSDNINIKYFKDLDQIVRIVVELYSDGSIKVPLTKNELKSLKVKIPTKIKKVLTKALNSQNNVDYAVEKMFKYYGFWKKIFYAIKWESDEKTLKKYPVFFELKRKLYENDRSNTFNGKIEKAKFNGDYNTAIRILATNPGFLMRNILEYIRYSKGTTIAKKVVLNKKDPNRYNVYTDDELFSNKINIGKILKPNSDDGKIKSREIVVKTDASEFFESEEFYSILLTVNLKLLWKTLSILDKKFLYENKINRLVQKIYISYERELPGLDKKLAKIVKKKIKKAIKEIKKEENISLGKVFISDDLKNKNIEFSGRESTGLTLSGEYLTPGSKISFDSLESGKIIRLGIAWRGESSCDIDHSLNLLNKGKSVYYGTPIYKENKEIIISSSGDITSCDNELFSTELIDIDLDLAVKYDLGNMLSSIIQYSGKTLDNYEVFWFMNIIDKKDRVTDGRSIHIALDQMDYAIQLNKETKSSLGFYINLKEKHIEVLNLELNMNDNYSNAVSNESVFKKVLEERDPLVNIYDTLKTVIKKSQIVDKIEDADTVLLSSVNEIKDAELDFFTPGRDINEFYKIIF